MFGTHFENPILKVDNIKINQVKNRCRRDVIIKTIFLNSSLESNNNILYTPPLLLPLGFILALACIWGAPHWVAELPGLRKDLTSFSLLFDCRIVLFFAESVPFYTPSVEIRAESLYCIVYPTFLMATDFKGCTPSEGRA